MLEDGINYILYFILFIAIYRLIMAINEKEIRGRKVRRDVKRRLQKQVIEHKVAEWKKNHYSLGNLELLLRATANSENKNPSVFAFLLLSGTLGLGTFLLLATRISDLFFSSAIALCVSWLPYLYLKVKLSKQKSSVTNDITSIIEELIHHYTANGHDMYKAVKNVAKNTKNNYYRRLFLQVASAMHLRHEESIREAVDVLVYAIGGTWAKRLGNIILTGYIRSNSVMKALVHLSNDAQNNEGMLTQEKASSFGTVIAAYATVPFMITTLLINNYLARAFDYWKVQFGNPMMVALFVITCVMIFISLLTAMYIRNPKNDI